MRRLLEEGFKLQKEIDRFKSGKVVRGKDKGVGPSLFEPPPLDFYQMEMQIDRP